MVFWTCIGLLCFMRLLVQAQTVAVPSSGQVEGLGASTVVQLKAAAPLNAHSHTVVYLHSSAFSARLNEQSGPRSVHEIVFRQRLFWQNVEPATRPAISRICE
jgi:hypothetical protein